MSNPSTSSRPNARTKKGKGSYSKRDQDAMQPLLINSVGKDVLIEGRGHALWLCFQADTHPDNESRDNALLIAEAILQLRTRNVTAGAKWVQENSHELLRIYDEAEEEAENLHFGREMYAQNLIAGIAMSLDLAVLDHLKASNR